MTSEPKSDHPWISGAQALLNGQLARLASKGCVRDSIGPELLRNGTLPTRKECTVVQDDIIKTLRDYNERREAYRGLTACLKHRFETAPLADRIFLIKGRTKDIFSLTRKIYRKALQDANPRYVSSRDTLYKGPNQHGFTDLAGLRIVLLYRSDYKTVHDYICQTFDGDMSLEAAKCSGGEPSDDCSCKIKFSIREAAVYRAHNETKEEYEFFKRDRCKIRATKQKRDSHVKKAWKIRDATWDKNYTSFHYVIRASLECCGEHPNSGDDCLASRLKKYNKLYVEIQVRTVLEEAWAEIQHHRNYHGDAPKVIKRQIDDLKAIIDTANSMVRNIELQEATQREVNWNQLVEYGQSAKYVLVASKDLQFTVDHLPEAARSWETAGGQFIYFIPEETDKKTKKNISIVEKRIECINARLQHASRQGARRVLLWRTRKTFFANIDHDRLYLRRVTMLERRDRTDKSDSGGGGIYRIVERDMYVNAQSRELSESGNVPDRVADEEDEEVGRLYGVFLSSEGGENEWPEAPEDHEELRRRRLVAKRHWFFEMAESVVGGASGCNVLGEVISSLRV